MRRTKIVATIGPASEDPMVLRDLIVSGLDVARINLSHGELAIHLSRLDALRRTASEVGRRVGILADLPGPKVRAGAFPEGGSLLLVGSQVALAPGHGRSSEATISVDYKSLLDDLETGDRVVVGDGAIRLLVESVDGSRALARVETGGRVMGRPGVHIPSERARLTSPTDADLALIGPLVGAGVDFIAVSFVRSAADLDIVRKACAVAAAGAKGSTESMGSTESTRSGGPPLIVAKIETSTAVADLNEIMPAADVVMVARGDLGIDMPLVDVPHIQKRVIRACVEEGVPVITATQMLESMTVAPVPTRAEVTDVANAVLDGTDAVMLSGETAIGSDPVLVVKTMAAIAERAESEANYQQWGARLGRGSAARRLEAGVTPARAITTAMTHAAWVAADDAGCAAIVCCTRRGYTARAMARFRPPSRLLAVTPSERTCQQLAVSWGVEPLLVDEYDSTDDLVWHAVEAVVRAGHATTGDIVAVLAGAPDSDDMATDVLRLVRVR